MKKLNTILSFISLSVTSFLLVLLVFAWYTTNKSANVRKSIGMVSDVEDIVESIEYFNFKSVSGNQYTVRQYVKDTHGVNSDITQIRYYYNEALNEGAGQEVPNPATVANPDGYDGKFVMNEFDYLKQGFSKYLIKVTLKEDKIVSDLSFISTAEYFIGYTNDSASDGSVTDVSGLSMSSVVKFGVLTSTPTISSDFRTVTFEDDATYSHFEYTNNSNEYTGAISASSQTIAQNLVPASGTKLSIYILIDYNLDALNAFYGNNLSTSSDWETSPKFTELDFRIFIIG